MTSEVRMKHHDTIHIRTLNIYMPSPGVLLRAEPPMSAVGSAVAAPKDRYQIADGIVIDHRLQLMWPVAESDEKMDHDGREQYARNFRLGSFDDWRQPDRWELASLFKTDMQKPCVDTSVFQSHGDCVGTREICTWSLAHVWVVGFDSGDVYGYVRHNKTFCRPVREVTPGKSE